MITLAPALPAPPDSSPPSPVDPSIVVVVAPPGTPPGENSGGGNSGGGTPKRRKGNRNKQLDDDSIKLSEDVLKLLRDGSKVFRLFVPDRTAICNEVLATNLKQFFADHAVRMNLPNPLKSKSNGAKSIDSSDNGVKVEGDEA